jgi:hypothetical protein
MYNATAYEIRNGKRVSCFVVELNEAGKILRSNSVQCTGLEGTEAYDSYLRLSHKELEIVRDGCDGYRNVVRSLNLPPTYLAA